MTRANKCQRNVPVQLFEPKIRLKGQNTSLLIRITGDRKKGFVALTPGLLSLFQFSSNDFSEVSNDIFFFFLTICRRWGQNVFVFVADDAVKISSSVLSCFYLRAYPSGALHCMGWLMTKNKPIQTFAGKFRRWASALLANIRVIRTTSLV